MVHHTIVALEGVYVPIPDLHVPAPHTCTVIKHHSTPLDKLHERVKDATILIIGNCPLDSTTLSAAIAPKLRLIVVTATGTDSIALDTCRERGIRVMNSPGANASTVAEHAIGMYFATRRRTVIMHERTRAGTEWREKASLISYMRDIKEQPPLTCTEEIVGVIGNGKVGSRIASLCRALGMKTVVADRKGASGTSPDKVPFGDVLRTASVFVLALPLVPSTMGLISADELELMRPEAIIINVARGDIVDETAVVSALRKRSIAGYATDVFSVEPADGGDHATNPLLTPDTKGLNISVSPHVAWFSHTTMKNFQDMMQENINNWCAGVEKNVAV